MQYLKSRSSMIDMQNIKFGRIPRLKIKIKRNRILRSGIKIMK